MNSLSKLCQSAASHERKFDALGLTFRVESLINVLFEELVDTINLSGTGDDEVRIGYTVPGMQEVSVKIYDDNGFFAFRANRDTANDLMGKRTALQAYIVEVVLGTAKKTRDELKIEKIEG